MSDMTTLKRAAANAALQEFHEGMVVGLGTGSTVWHVVDLLGEKVRNGFRISAVPTSIATAEQAKTCGIQLTTLDEHPLLDVTIDGADEISPDLALIKGGGGALLREKIVAANSKKFVVVADHSKLVDTLGLFPLPVEVVPFGAGATRQQLEALGKEFNLTGVVRQRFKDGNPFISDNGNYIYDCAWQRLDALYEVAEALYDIVGVVEHGLFLDMAETAYVATPDGVKKIEG